MINFFRSFANDGSGAVTVDWVVLTAAVVGLGLAASVEIANGTVELGESMNTFLETDTRLIQNR